MIEDKRLRLQRFDFGTDCANRTRFYETCNQQRYGTLLPPEYNLANIKVPMFLLQGESVGEEPVVPTTANVLYFHWARIPGATWYLV